MSSSFHIDLKEFEHFKANLKLSSLKQNLNCNNLGLFYIYIYINLYLLNDLYSCAALVNFLDLLHTHNKDIYKCSAIWSSFMWRFIKICVYFSCTIEDIHAWYQKSELNLCALIWNQKSALNLCARFRYQWGHSYLIPEKWTQFVCTNLKPEKCTKFVCTFWIPIYQG